MVGTTPLLTEFPFITDCAEVVYSKHRFRVHQRYFFDCICSACKKDWPKIENLPSAVGGLPKTAHVDKESAKRLRNMIKSKDNLKGKAKKKRELLKATNECLKLAEKVLVRPHALLCTLEEEIHTCLISIHGTLL